MIRKELLILFLILFSGIVVGNSIGALPGTVDLGTVERGETVEEEIYIRSVNVGQEFNITPSTNSIEATGLFDDSFSDAERISENSGEDWWETESTSVNPDTTINNDIDLDIPDDNIPDIHGSTTLTLNVPQDAEPGVRHGYIHLNPEIATSGSGGAAAGATFVAPTRIRYTFNIPGEVQRNIVVQDVRAFRLGEDEAAVEVLLRNEGTVTTSTEDFQVDVLDSTGATEATLTAGDAVLEPGEERYVEASWGSEDGIEEGAYQIDGEVDYLTGEATASGSFSLPGFDVVEVRPDDSPAVDGEQDRGGLPLWLVAMILVLLGVLMWSFGIDPFWILLIVGIFGISAFILMSGISNYLLILLLMVVGIVVYGGL